MKTALPVLLLLALSSPSPAADIGFYGVVSGSLDITYTPDGIPAIVSFPAVDYVDGQTWIFTCRRPLSRFTCIHLVPGTIIELLANPTRPCFPTAYGANCAEWTVSTIIVLVPLR